MLRRTREFAVAVMELESTERFLCFGEGAVSLMQNQAKSQSSALRGRSGGVAAEAPWLAA